MTFFKILVSFLCSSTLFFISCFVTSFFHLILYNECLDHYTDFSNVTFNVYMSYIIWMCFRNNWLSGFCLNFTFFPHYSCPSHHQPEKLQISSTQNESSKKTKGSTEHFYISIIVTSTMAMNNIPIAETVLKTRKK